MTEGFEDLRRNLVIQRELQAERKITEETIMALSKADGCPCNVKPFIYWVGKHHENRIDFLQDGMIEVLLFKLKLFLEIPNQYSESYNHMEDLPYVKSYICPKCYSLWELFSREWRMMAVTYCLRRMDIDDPSGLYPELIGNTGTQRGGKKWSLASQKVLNHEGLQEFLLREKY